MFPKSDFERFLGAFVFLFGVATFSYVMGNFIEILSFIKELNEDLTEGEQLNQFLSLLRKFNDNKPIN